jgi:hypothetical protein
MEQNKILVTNPPLGSVFKCPGGIIHVNINGVSLHFEELVFSGFFRICQDASSKLMDDGLKNILADG